MAKKKSDEKKKKIIQIVMLLSVLAAFAMLMIFVTLPALGIELFGGRKTSRSTLQPSATPVRQTTTSSYPSSSPKPSPVDEEYLTKVMEELSGEEEEKNIFVAEAFKPYIFNFQDEGQVKDILINSNNIIEFRDGTFMSYFLTKGEEKTAWIKTSAEPNKVYELKINSVIPNVPYPLQVIEITPMGILLYRYPDEKEIEEQATPRLYRILARPFIEISDLKTEIKQ